MRRAKHSCGIRASQRKSIILSEAYGCLLYKSLLTTQPFLIRVFDHLEKLTPSGTAVKVMLSAVCIAAAAGLSELMNHFAAAAH